MATIILPKSTSELIQLGQNIVYKHMELFVNNDEQGKVISAHIKDLEKKLTEVKPKYEDMLLLREKFDLLNDQLKMACGTHNSNRKISPGTIKFVIAQVRDILKGIHREDLKLLREWGFEVTERD